MADFDDTLLGVWTVCAPRLCAEVDYPNLAEIEGVTAEEAIVLYKILMADSTPAMVTGVPDFIGT